MFVRLDFLYNFALFILIFLPNMKQIVLFFAFFSVSYSLLAQTDSISSRTERLDRRIEELELYIRNIKDSLRYPKNGSAFLENKLASAKMMLRENEEALKQILKKNPEKIIDVLEKADLNSPYFMLSPQVRSDIIQNKKGQYYYFDVTNPYYINPANTHEQALVLFEVGRYTKMFNGDENILNTALMHIINAVRRANKRNGDRKYEIYVSGSADILGDTSFVGDQQTEMFQFYNPLTVLKHQPAMNQYAYTPVKIPAIGRFFNNRELATLRSAYIEKRLLENEIETIPPQNTHIVEGKVTGIVNPADRNVRILVYFESK
ncbi:MAG: hypothetical protein EAZ95_07925 [Bacteroidetes bacterium]|nr:MAG: hypothetical protein EAZ95_07925 [Bacteroidota bacterium]